MAPSTVSYQQIPTDDTDDVPSSGRSSTVGGRSVDGPAQQRPPQPTDREVRETVAGRRFNPPPPAPYKRVRSTLLPALMLFLRPDCVVGWLGGPNRLSCWRPLPSSSGSPSGWARWEATSLPSQASPAHSRDEAGSHPRRLTRPVRAG